MSDPLSPGAIADDEMLTAGYGVPDVPPGWPALDPVAFKGLAGDVVRFLAPETEADPAALLLTFLASFGSAVGPGPHALVGGAKHPPRLNVLLVGDTSRARKGTSWAEVARVMAIADPAWTSERVTSGLASGEGLIKALDGAADLRLLVVEPEYARTLSVCGREGSTLSAVIRQCWDSGDLRVMTRKDPLAVTGAHVCLLGHITGEELGRRLCETEAANGYMNRHLVVVVRRSTLLPSGGEVDAAGLDELGRRVRAALHTARRVTVVRRTALAEKFWAGYYAEMADGPGGLAGAVTSRAEAQTLRLSVLYALLDGTNRIDVEQLEAAYAVWRYCETSALLIFGDALGDDVADRLLEALRTVAPDGLDVSAQRDLFSRHISAERLRLARAELVRRGFAEERTEQTGGRPRLLLYSACAESVSSARRGLSAPRTLSAQRGNDR
jgi:hypothetical protein